MPASSAASITARVPARSSRRPKLLQPRPTAETVSSERPSGFWRMRVRMAAAYPGRVHRSHSRRRRRRRRRSMFSRPPSGPASVRWLQPVQRRRRRRAPAGPILLGVLLLALAGGAFAFVRSRDDGEDPSRAIAQRFADAWAAGDLEAAWRLTTATTRAEQRLSGFRESYRQATRAATVTEVRVGRAGEPRGGRVPVPVVLRTRLFGVQRGTIEFPVERSGETARVAWMPALRLPGLRPGERVHRRILRQPRRAPVLDADGRRLSRTSTAAGSGRRGAVRRRSRQRPGGALRRPARRPPRRRAALRPAADRPRRASSAGRPVKTTVRPSLQSAATRALGGRLGGVAVIRPRNGDVLALAGLAVSGPQPPGSVVQDHHARRGARGAGDAAERVVPGPDGRDARGRGAAQRGRRVVRRHAHRLVRALLQLRLRAAGRAARREAARRRTRSSSASTSGSRSRPPSRARSRSRAS